MSVTKAAQLIGVGRPALSNLLNGKASLSADMAARLEKAFNYPREGLMEMQARYDAVQAKQKNAPTDTKAYVPPYLTIKANDIEQWVSHNIPARSRLAVFLRTLVNSTCNTLTKVDFPGNDDAERPGWDGFVEAGEGTPWVPTGRSGWEFGINEDPKSKAEEDFSKSVKALTKKECANTTFVFVTPRRWPGKTTWVAAMQAKGIWKDVCAYDTSDLEQWLEQSLPAQAWFANETNIPAQDVRSLDKCWADWAEVTKPHLTGALFSSAIDASRRTMLSSLSKPSEGPILIAADSTEEALAFLSQLFGQLGGEELASYRDRILVFDKPGTLPRLAMGAQTFIPVVFTREAERELAPFAKSMSSIVIYPRNSAMAEPNIVLEPVNYETFNTSLEDMGMYRDEIARLANESGRSLTVLRRRLSTVPAMQIPEWAADRKIAASLVPFLLLGAWNSQNETDKTGLCILAGDRPYEELEKECQSLAQLNDAPIWSVGVYRGVISKIDLLFAIAFAITPDALNRYFSMARIVLGEDDPALDLDEDKRWAASIYGKSRKFSSAFREGISETLVLLAVHGHSFKSRLGVDTEIEAVQVVRGLLPSPLTTRVLEANDRDLPTYAEAAPDEFLSILERDLKTDTPAVLGLLRSVDPGVLGRSPSRTGLLWALEGLSWSPETLPRAASILACLAQVEINDNWVNKPTYSLKSIFRAWMPQTAADHEQRVDLMMKLAKKFPDVAWKICIAQFDTHDQVGNYSHKPRWRPDGYGFGEPFSTMGPILSFRREMVDMALTWKDHSLSMLCDLVERLNDLTEVDQARVWTLVEAWANAKASDSDKAVLREKIRVSTLSRRAAVRAKKNGRATSLATAGRAVFDALEPRDLLNKHSWLFRDHWVEESVDKIEDIETIDVHKREERINNLRIEALREIQTQLGLAGIVELSKRGKASWAIGMLMASAVLPEKETKELLLLALTPILDGKEEVHSYKNLIAGTLQGITDAEKRETALQYIAARLPEEDKGRLFVLAPYCKSTWKLVDAAGEMTRAKYWSEVMPSWIPNSDSENSESVERLLLAGRPRAAFSCIQFEPSKLDVQVLYRLLFEMALGGDDQPGEYMLDRYYIGEAFKHLDNSQALALDQKAGLEFAYIDVLAQPWDQLESYGIPNLERYVETHPEFFVQAVAWTYKRTDGATDPSELQVPPERIATMAERGYKLLNAIQRIPGHNDLGELESVCLEKWITNVRQSSAELSRTDITDVYIGQILSSAPMGKDGIWPCEPVRDAMEDIQSESMARGMCTGVFTARGVVMHGEGGSQERELVSKYRKWAEALQISHPFVASKLLLDIAKNYEHEATREDLEAGIRRRMR
jgi:Plasmid maintenance system antidote protein